MTLTPFFSANPRILFFGILEVAFKALTASRGLLYHSYFYCCSYGFNAPWPENRPGFAHDKTILDAGFFMVHTTTWAERLPCPPGKPGTDTALFFGILGP